MTPTLSAAFDMGQNAYHFSYGLCEIVQVAVDAVLPASIVDAGIIAVSNGAGFNQSQLLLCNPGASCDTVLNICDLPAQSTPHVLTFFYAGNANFLAATSQINVLVARSAVQIMSFQSSTRAAVYGTSVTLTVSITAENSGGVAATGTVLFQDGGVDIGESSLLSGYGSATFELQTVGPHLYSISYAGDSNYLPVASDQSQNIAVDISKAPTVCALFSDPSAPAQFGRPIAFKLVVSSTPAPPVADVVYLFTGAAVTLGQRSASLESNEAMLTITEAPIGVSSAQASYPSSTNFNGCSADKEFEFIKGFVSLSVSSSASIVEYGVPVELTVSLSAEHASSQTPAGSLVAKLGGQEIATGTAISGTGFLVIPGLTLSTTSSIVIEYAGSFYFNAALGTLLQEVRPADVVITVISNPVLTSYGQAFTATVQARPASVSSVAVVAGFVSLLVNNEVLGAQSLDQNGNAVISVGNYALSVDSYSIQASFSGDLSLFTVSQVIPAAQAVSKAVTTISAALLPSLPVVFGQTSSVTGDVGFTFGGAGLHQGSVQLFVNGAFSGASALTEFDSVSLSTASFQVGLYDIQLKYVSNDPANIEGSQSAILVLTVEKGNLLLTELLRLMSVTWITLTLLILFMLPQLPPACSSPARIQTVRAHLAAPSRSPHVSACSYLARARLLAMCSSSTDPSCLIPCP